MADKVISLLERWRGRSGTNPLNVLLNRAQILRSGLKEEQGIVFKNPEELPRFFESILAKVLLEAKIIEEDCFLCGVYISLLLARVANFVPSSWYAVDYVMEGHQRENPLIWKEGADLCFLFCSLFKERANRRATSVKDYKIMGGRLYLDYSAATGREIGFKMSRHFELMAGVTEEAVASLKI